jgi:hypothetical protein
MNNTANGIRSAVVKVLAVLENWEDADIKGSMWNRR